MENRFFPVSISNLVGKTFVHVTFDKEEIVFDQQDGTEYKMFHRQDCCERVTLDEWDGEIDYLVGSPITKAEVRTNEGGIRGDYTYTWTFYLIETVKGSVHLKWYGSSNGYYSESVDIYCWMKGRCDWCRWKDKACEYCWDTPATHEVSDWV